MPVPLTPIRFLYRALDLYSNNTAVVCSGRRYTYSEFVHRCEQLAAALRQLAINPGDRVAYLSFNNHRLLEGYYGVPMAGALVTPLNVRLAVPELIEILNHCEPAALLFEDDFSPCTTAFRTACPSIKHFISLEGASQSPDDSYEHLLSQASPEACDFTAVDEASIAELFYTSGSTGHPKGVMLSHRALYLHA
ncbi:MAG: AMP-binding protein [Acidobacteriaceae bacterium]|nr:AMP-binding protein [Acidobacteriaceae bacterium]